MNIHQILIYDGSFEGLLTAIFEVFEYRFHQADIIPRHRSLQEMIFTQTHEVVTQPDKADRVLKRLEANVGKQGVLAFLAVYLSEKEGVERLILNVVRHSVRNPNKNILNDIAHPDVMEFGKIWKSVFRESHRMKAFVRFERLQDDSYFAKIEPDFNVLPLVMNFFKQRYADQKWMIYDLKRKYAVIYDLSTVDIYYPEEDQTNNFTDSESYHHTQEKGYQVLWQRYFAKINIAERKNTPLHTRHMPKRYWKYLTEKNGLRM